MGDAGTSLVPPTGDAVRLADHLFRHESSRLVSVLTRMFGVQRLQLAEDVAQEALIRALQTWPYYGVPQNPAAWLTQTAKNLALDVIRREKVFRDKEPAIADLAERWLSEPVAVDSVQFDAELKDDTLRLMFACCHPMVPPDARVALALKTLCGFNVSEIAKAFLSTEAAIAKRLTRARRRIRELNIPYEIPTGDEAASRVESVEQTLYLLFNEGYKASSGDALIRADLCFEAIRLATLLAEHPVGFRPRTHALIALMLLNAARLPARVDELGRVVRLEDQDRSRWDRALIARGMFHLEKSGAGREISEYHLQAGIAACHCAAPDYASTDWRQILALYDRLVALDDSPVAALNRAVAVANVHGPLAGMNALETMRHRSQLEGYYLLYAVLAEFEMQLQRYFAAAQHLERAIELTDIASEKEFLRGKLEYARAAAASALEPSARA